MKTVTLTIQLRLKFSILVYYDTKIDSEIFKEFL